jgi:hypothetical protein
VGQDDEARLDFDYRLRRQALFGEWTVEEVADARDRRVVRRKRARDARKQMEIEPRMSADDEKHAEGCVCADK